jgi:hypothetical protein
MTEEVFDLNREISTERNIDPLGRKWDIVHLKGSSLYECRPNPYNAATEIPDEFKGRWTKPVLLQEQVKLYLNRSWDKADQAALHAASRRRSQEMREMTKEENVKKKTAKESLDELPEEIKRELGDTIATTKDK